MSDMVLVCLRNVCLRKLTHQHITPTSYPTSKYLCFSTSKCWYHLIQTYLWMFINVYCCNLKGNGIFFLHVNVNKASAFKNAILVIAFQTTISLYKHLWMFINVYCCNLKGNGIFFLHVNINVNVYSFPKFCPHSDRKCWFTKECS